MTLRQFDELQAFDTIDPISLSPCYRLLVYMAWSLANQWNSGDTVTMKTIAEFAGLPSDQFNEGQNVFQTPEQAATSVRGMMRG